MTEITTKDKGSKKKFNINAYDVIIGIWEFVFMCSLLYAISMVALGTKDIILILPTLPLIIYCMTMIGKRFIISRQGDK